MAAHMSPRDLKPGQWVDGFRIVRRIGQGYFGLVFEVEKGGSAAPCWKGGANGSAASCVARQDGNSTSGPVIQRGGTRPPISGKRS
jgi:hypothetical protein